MLLSKWKRLEIRNDKKLELTKTFLFPKILWLSFIFWNYFFHIFSSTPWAVHKNSTLLKLHLIQTNKWNIYKTECPKSFNQRPRMFKNIDLYFAACRKVDCCFLNICDHQSLNFSFDFGDPLDLHTIPEILLVGTVKQGHCVSSFYCDLQGAWAE